MELLQIFKICLDFAIANGGSMTHPMGNKKFWINSRTTRTEILIEKDSTRPGVWQAEQIQNAVGEKNPTKETISSEEQMLNYLSRFWDKVEVPLDLPLWR